MKTSTLSKSLFLFLLFAFFWMGKASAQITPTVTVTDASVCIAPCNGTATTNDLTALGATYAWNTTPVQNTVTAVVLCPGTYSVTITTTFGSVVGTGTVGCSSGVFDIATASALNVFPNPATESVMLDVSSAQHGSYTMNIVTILGEKIRSEKIYINGNLNKVIDVSDLKHGIYFIELRSEKEFYAGKLLKQ